MGGNVGKFCKNKYSVNVLNEVGEVESLGFKVKIKNRSIIPIK